MDYLNISLIPVQDYCEYQLYLRCFKNVRAAPTWQMLNGTRRHALLEERFLETAAPLARPLPEQIRMSASGQDGAFSIRETWLESREQRLRGKADEIIVSSEGAFIIDDKPRMSEGAKNQVRAYCLAFREQFAFDHPLYSLLRYRDSQQMAWEEPFDTPAEHHIKNIVKRVWSIVSGTPGDASGNANKCRACRYSYACDRVVHL